MAQDPELLIETYRHLLARLSDATKHHAGARPMIPAPATPAAIAAAGDDLGSPIPIELAALYRVANGLEAFGHVISPVERLVEINAFAREYFEDFEVPGEIDSRWGPRPEGPSLVISSAQALFLMLEVDGPHAGRLTAFDASGDLGYRPAAPSLEAMLDCWAAIAEAGLIELLSYDQQNVVEVPVDLHDRVCEFLEAGPCSPACVWILRH